MALLRVPKSELSSDPYDDFFDVRYRGEPFTGVGLVDEESCVGEVRYENGLAHGRGFYQWRNGQPMSEFELDRGMHVGESRDWYESGQLRTYCRHSPYLRREYDATGLLVFEDDRAEERRRKWYPSGVLREERLGDVRSVFTPAGNLALVQERLVQIGEAAHIAHRFIDSVMLAELEVLASDPEHEYDVFMYVHSLLSGSRAAGAQVLRRLLGHPSRWVVSTSLAIAGNARVLELRDLVSALQDDARIPPREQQGTGSRSATRSLGEVAREALRKMK